MRLKAFLSAIPAEGEVSLSQLFAITLPLLEDQESARTYAEGIASGKALFEVQLPHLLDQHFKLCCFSETLDSILMWSHYADKYRGFALAYSFERPVGTIEQGYGVEYLSLFPVKYVTSSPGITPAMAHIDETDFKDRAFGDFAELLFEKNAVL